MPSGLLSNLNTVIGFGFRKSVRVNEFHPLYVIEGCLSRKSSTLHFSRRIMAVSGSISGSTDLVMDNLVSSCGNVSGFAKPGSVYFSDGLNRSCRKASVRMRNGESKGCNGVKGYLFFDAVRRSCNSNAILGTWASNWCAFSSSSYSEGVMPEVSADGFPNAEQLTTLAISAEQKPPSNRALKLNSGACYMPHPAKEATGGEDAHFIHVDGRAIGVADGVGGWADVGIDAGEYARELMSNSVNAIQHEPDSDVDPLRVLEKAHATTKAMGSSTACILTLKNQDLNAINLGDSGFIVIRDGFTVFESPAQQHGFNMPYQLEKGSRSDLPSSGQVFEIPVAPGDVIVAGTDGLFDNLFNKEIETIVADATKEGLSPDATAQKIASFARVRAESSTQPTPFSTAAQQAGYSYFGGKLDDITVVVSYVCTSGSD